MRVDVHVHMRACACPCTRRWVSLLTHARPYAQVQAARVDTCLCVSLHAQVLTGLTYQPEQNLAVVDFYSEQNLPEGWQARGSHAHAAKCVGWCVVKLCWRLCPKALMLSPGRASARNMHRQ